MTADSTTRLREALAEALDPWEVFTASDGGSVIRVRKATDLADAILATLAEHRDDVLDVLGMGERCGACGGDEACQDHNLVNYNLVSHPYSPVYAFRRQEQPHGGCSQPWHCPCGCGAHMGCLIDPDEEQP